MKFLYLNEHHSSVAHTTSIIVNAAEIIFMYPAKRDNVNLTRIVLKEHTEFHVINDIVEIWEMLNG